jgi:hypothetical protein
MASTGIRSASEPREAIMRSLSLLFAIVLSFSAVSANAAGKDDKPTAEDIAKICLAVANVCNETCNQAQPHTGSFSGDMSEVLGCSDRCAEQYRKCVGGLPVRATHPTETHKATQGVVAP